MSALGHHTPVNLLHIFRTLFPKNTSGGLLLQVIVISLEMIMIIIIRLAKITIK